MELYHGDCLEIMKTLPKESVDCVIADLPYGITSAKWDSEIPLDLLWNQYNRVAKKDAPFVLFASQPFTSKLISSKINWFKYCWYWEKEKGTGFLNAKIQPLRCVEEICIFYRKSGKYNPQMKKLDKPYTHKLPTKSSETVNKVSSYDEKIRYKTYTHSYPKNVLKFPRDNSNKGIHSTQKPIQLLEYLIQTYSDEGDVILDNTMGSGSTGIACQNLKREFVGIELDKNIFDLAIQRFSDELNH